MFKLGQKTSEIKKSPSGHADEPILHLVARDNRGEPIVDLTKSVPTYRNDWDEV